MRHFAFIILTVISLLPSVSSGENYQYQYFNRDKDKYVPFSDYIPQIRRHNYTVPHFLEDYYLLYGMKQYYDENSLRMNILRMKTALECNFRHPSNALIKISTDEEYLKYRNLFFMHINMLLCRDYLKIALRYDKRKIYFFDADQAKMLSDSLEAAKLYYKDAFPYWYEAKKYAEQASKIKVTTDLGYMETERFRIIKGDLDMEKIIKRDLASLEKKIAQLKSMETQDSR